MLSVYGLSGKRVRAVGANCCKMISGILIVSAIFLMGAASAAPVIYTSPDSLYQALNVGDSATQTLTIGNSGDAALDYSIAIAFSSAAHAAGATRPGLLQPAELARIQSLYQDFADSKDAVQSKSMASAPVDVRQEKLYKAIAAAADTAVIFFDDVEGDTAGWTHYPRVAGELDYWSVSTTRSSSGSHSWHVAQHDYDGAEVLLTPTIDLSLLDEATLTFLHWYNFDDCEDSTFAPDGGFLQITTDNGATWTKIYPVGGYPYVLNNDCANPYFLAEAYAHDGYNGNFFIPAIFDLTPFVGHQVRIMFTAGWDCGNCATNEGWYIDDVTVYSISPLDWLSTAQTSGTIPAGGTADLDFLFDATQMYGGLYTAGIEITSNDPSTPLLAVPAVLDVTGIPDIAVAPLSLSYPTTLIGGAAFDTVTIANAGSDSLIISSIVSDNSDFTAPPVTPSIGPGKHYRVPVQFGPTTSGTITGVLTISSNDPDEPAVAVSLEGTGITAPVISVTPDSLDQVLISGDTAVQQLSVANTGGAPLDWQLEIVEPNSQYSEYTFGPPSSSTGAPPGESADTLSSSQRSTGTTAELIDLTGIHVAFEDYSSYASTSSYLTMTSDIVSRGATVGNFTGPYTAQDLDTIDILWFADVFSWSQGTLAIPLRDFVLSGGSVILEGDNVLTQTAFNELLDSLDAAIRFAGNAPSSGYSSNIFPHPTTEGVGSLYFNSPVTQLDLSSGNAVLIAEGPDSAPLIAVEQFGGGYVFAISDELVYSSYVSYADVR